MLTTRQERIEYSLHLAIAELCTIREMLEKPDDMDRVLKEIEMLREKINMRYFAKREAEYFIKKGE